jgi:hypothetical protein
LKKSSCLQSFLVLLLLLSTFGLHAQTYSGGTGTDLDPYMISTKADLHYLSENVNHWDKHFVQTADIYFVSSDFQIGGSFYNNGEGFKTLGTDFATFLGTYDGRGHIIDSLYINRPTEDYQGFFGKKVWGSIRDLGLTNIFVKGQNYNGALVGYFDDGDIADCYVTGTVTGTLNYTGGLAGHHSNGIITRSHATVNVEGNVIGGLIGHLENSFVNKCYATGNVIGTTSSYTGGLIGLMQLSSPNNAVTDCYASGNVSGNYAVGGLIGHSGGNISNCFSSGSVNGNYSGGGLVGFASQKGSILNCYATGTVTGIQFLGGLIGYNSGDVRNCHSVGTVSSNTGNDTIGGLSGGNEGNFHNCFWDMQTSGLTNSFGGNGLLTSDMTNIPVFTSSSWDFEIETPNGTENIWKISKCSFDYPVFNWQTTIPNPTSISTGSGCESFFWDLNGLTYISTGIYLSVVPNPSGCDSIFVLDLTINDLPSNFVYNNEDGTLISSFGTSYQWVDCETNIPIADATEQVFAPVENGFYYALIYIDQCFVISDCIAMENLGLGNWSESSVEVFPNPAKNTVIISIPVNSAKLRITDAQGKTQFFEQITNGQQIDISFYENGVYLLTLESETEKVVKRIVKNG